jgi:hypothetical protein
MGLSARPAGIDLVLVEASGYVKQSDGLADVKRRLLVPSPVDVVGRALGALRSDAVDFGKIAREKRVAREQAYVSPRLEVTQRTLAVWLSVAGRLVICSGVAWRDSQWAWVVSQAWCSRRAGFEHTPEEHQLRISALHFGVASGR